MDSTTQIYRHRGICKRFVAGTSPFLMRIEMPDGGTFVRVKPLFDLGAKRQNSTAALLLLLADILPGLGDKDPCARTRAARQLDLILAIKGVSWEALAYIIARYGDRSAEASARLLLS